MQIRVLSDDDVQRLLDLDDLLDALARGFSALTAGQVAAPPRNGVDVSGGFLLSMVAHAPAHPMGVKLVSVFHGNHRVGLPGHLALISLFDERTGAPTAVMNGTYITAMRTAGGAALSTRLLSRPDSRTLAIVGAGVQGASHVRMLSRVRDFTDIRVASLSLADAERVAAADPRVTATASAEDAVRGADVVCLCTTSPTPSCSGTGSRLARTSRRWATCPPAASCHATSSRARDSSWKRAWPTPRRPPGVPSSPASTPTRAPNSATCCWTAART